MCSAVTEEHYWNFGLPWHSWSSYVNIWAWLCSSLADYCWTHVCILPLCASTGSFKNRSASTMSRLYLRGYIIIWKAFVVALPHDNLFAFDNGKMVYVIEGYPTFTCSYSLFWQHCQQQKILFMPSLKFCLSCAIFTSQHLKLVTATPINAPSAGDLYPDTSPEINPTHFLCWQCENASLTWQN